MNSNLATRNMYVARRRLGPGFNTVVRANAGGPVGCQERTEGVPRKIRSSDPQSKATLKWRLSDEVSTEVVSLESQACEIALAVMKHGSIIPYFNA